MEKMKQITEQQVQEFCDIMEEMSKTLDEYHRLIEKSSCIALREGVVNRMEKFFVYIDKYLHATFVTRWYWLRKIRNENDVLHKFVEFYNDYAKQIGKDPATV